MCVNALVVKGRDITMTIALGQFTRVGGVVGFL